MQSNELQWTLLFCCFLPPANEVWGKVIFSVACVKNSVNMGVCLSARWDTPQNQALPFPRTRDPPPQDQAPHQTRYPPRTRHPPRPGTPQSRHPQDQAPPQTKNPSGPGTPPQEQCMLGDTVNERAVCILLECNLVKQWILFKDTTTILDTRIRIR